MPIISNSTLQNRFLPILFALSWTALLQQVAQRIVGVGIGEGIVGIDLQPAGAAGEPVQRIIGKRPCGS